MIKFDNFYKKFCPRAKFSRGETYGPKAQYLEGARIPPTLPYLGQKDTIEAAKFEIMIISI
ncbi:MAG: hypothetical protein LBS22_00240 [Puniceicoccales bacterium]|jgi:hypothetical protein|nr:hypothetical protein [Puniceicoccales bacterium]